MCIKLIYRCSNLTQSINIQTERDKETIYYLNKTMVMEMVMKAVPIETHDITSNENSE